MARTYTEEEMRRIRRIAYLEGKIEGVALGLNPPPRLTAYEVLEPLHREASALTIEHLTAKESA